MSFKKAFKEFKSAVDTMKMIVGLVAAFVGGIFFMCQGYPHMFRSGVCLIVAALFLCGALGTGLYAQAKKAADNRRSSEEEITEASITNEKTSSDPEKGSVLGVALIGLGTFGVLYLWNDHGIAR